LNAIAKKNVNIIWYDYTNTIAKEEKYITVYKIKISLDYKIIVITFEYIISPNVI
jgi:hypothetical protein